MLAAPVDGLRERIDRICAELVDAAVRATSAEFVAAVAAPLPVYVLGELLGLPGERIAPMADVADRPASYLSAVVVPARPSP